MNTGLSPGSPYTKKRLPFPLENAEEEIATLYDHMDILAKKMEVVKRNNVFGEEKARAAKLRKMQFKLNTMKSLAVALVKDLDDFWI